MRRLFLTVILVVAVFFPTSSTSDETLWGAAADSSGGITGWPTLENLGGTGRPTQALIVDSAEYSQRLSGPGLDGGSTIYGTGCVADHDDDLPCTTIQSPSSLITGITATVTAWSANSSMTPDFTDTGSVYLCRDDDDWVHESGQSNSIAVGTLEGKSYPVILRDDSADVYRLLAVDGQSLDCVNESGPLGMRNQVGYEVNTADDFMLAINDAVHLSQYGARQRIQKLLLSTFEDQYPEVLGVSNLIADGYFESGCGGLGTLSTGSAAQVAVENTSQKARDPFIGLGCEWTGMSAGATATTATFAATSGEYYVGSVSLNLNAVNAADRSFHLSIKDNGGNIISNTKFWFDGIPVGGFVEAADDVDSASVSGTAGQVDLLEKGCYGGCTIRFAFQVQAGDTGFNLVFTADQTYQILFDEFWVRPKVYSDLKRHYIIQDGRADIQIVSDSRGSRYEGLSEALDYMLGYTTKNGDSRTSIRPNLYPTMRPSDIDLSYAGETLGERVGDWDGDKGYDGTDNTEHLDKRIHTSSKYVVGMFGINDARSVGGNARPTENATDKHLYFGDAWTGFEQAVERNGAIPIILMDVSPISSTTVNACVNDSGSASNCGQWHNDAWKNLLHTGIN